ncbi:hypothetical protein HJFPF1_07067 [Paramyrothecium foliicola]|nr:hypothetical protein HJFPF1_07067 [Paramyrothecium foliicola]
MADPISVAGTAVGIVSLGIQVCQGLVSYLQAVKDRSSHIADGLKEVQELVSLFNHLNDVLSKIDNAACAESTTVKKCLGDCQGKLLELERFLFELKGASNPTSKKRQIIDAVGRLSYPFREGKLISLRESLRELLDNLHLAVDLIALETNVTQANSIAAVKTTVGEVASTSKMNNNRLDDISASMKEFSRDLSLINKTTGEILRGIQERTEKIELAVKDLEQGIGGKLTLLHDETQAVATNSQLTFQNTTEIINRLDSQSLMLSQMVGDFVTCPLTRIDSTKAMQVSRYDEIQGSAPPSAQEPLTENRMEKPATPLLKRGQACTCQQRQSKSVFAYRFGNVRFRYEQDNLLEHSRGCKFYGIKANQKRNSKAEVHFALQMAWLTKRITVASLELTRGGYSLSASVRYKNIVPRMDDPVCRLFIDELEDWRPKPGASSTDAVQRIESVERAMLSLYRDGKSSPGDRDEDGESHLEIFVQALNLWISGDDIPDLFDDGVMAAAKSVFESLVELVQPNVVKGSMIHLNFYMDAGAASKRGALWNNVHRWFSLLHEVYEYDANELMDPSTFSSYIDYTQRSLSKPFPGVSDLDVPPIVRAIMLRSLPELEKCIVRDPEVLLKKFTGTSVLQLIALWPEGLRRLLQTEAQGRLAERPDLYQTSIQASTSPLFIAVKHGALSSMDMLMKARCYTNLYTRELLLTINDSPQCFGIFLGNLVQERKELLSIAQKGLGILEKHDETCILDYEAADVINAFTKANIWLDPAQRLDKRHSTIYHLPWFDVERFPILLQYGFKDYNRHDAVGLTPFMIPRLDSNWQTLPTFLPWLESEGYLGHKPVDALGLGLNVDATDWHYLATYLGRALRTAAGTMESAWALVDRVSRLSLRDKCDCWCNLDGKGCSPMKMAWKVYRRQHRGTCAQHILLHHATQPESSPEEKKTSSALEIVRFLTFEALEMRHTCCSVHEKTGFLKRRDLKLPYWAVPGVVKSALIISCDPEVFRSVRSDSDELEKVQLLNSLMKEFSQNLGKLDECDALEQFLWGYWRRRISELYFITPESLQEMEQLLNNVKTFVLPEKVRDILGPQFRLQSHISGGISDRESHSQASHETSAPPSCDLCEHQTRLSRSLQYAESSLHESQSQDSGYASFCSEAQGSQRTNSSLSAVAFP